jgi:hypothetical protein
MLMYQLRNSKTPATQKLVAEYFMGQEDGMYPDGPGWGPPSPVASRRLRRAYAEQYRWGYRLYTAALAATPEELQAAVRFVVLHYSQEWQSIDDPVRVVAAIEAHYRKYKRTRRGWKGFLHDLADATAAKARSGPIEFQPASGAAIGLQRSS